MRHWVLTPFWVIFDEFWRKHPPKNLTLLFFVNVNQVISLYLGLISTKSSKLYFFVGWAQWFGSVFRSFIQPSPQCSKHGKNLLGPPPKKLEFTTFWGC